MARARTRISVEPTEIRVGGTVTFKLEDRPQGGITWTTDAPGDLEETDGSVELTPAQPGSYTVTATVGDRSWSIPIVVCAEEMHFAAEVASNATTMPIQLSGLVKNQPYVLVTVPDVGHWLVGETDPRSKALSATQKPEGFKNETSATLVFDGPKLANESSFQIQLWEKVPKEKDNLVRTKEVRVVEPPRRPITRTGVTLQRTERPATPDQILWVMIRNSSLAMSFRNYLTFMNVVFCGDLAALCGSPEERKKALADAREQAADSVLRLPFPGVDPYRMLKAATEVFVTSRCGILRFDPPLVAAEERRRGVDIGDNAEALAADYLKSEDPQPILPYLALVLSRLGEVRLVKRLADTSGEEYAVCEGILQSRLAYPCFIELIWSYWHEEAMLAQAMNAISHRFQNLRAPGPRDPLAQLEIDPLRPLNNLLWGYVQDDMHRLSVLRRAHEYDHHYGLTLYGKAVAELRTADGRSKFLEAFHNLLYQTAQFYRQDDDTTVIADGFPVLNAIKETHYLLAQGAHNQFGDLPSTARQEMLIEQWLLSRPEMREFLGGRIMVPYPEPWMDKVDVVKSLKGWTDVSVVHFHDLAVFGEQILLSVRYGAWSTVNEPDQAANWARYWRPEVQGYIHGYRAVTGIDLTADVTDQQQLTARYLPPSVHLRNRLSGQQGGQAGALYGRTVVARLVAEGRTPALPAARRRQLTRGSD